MNTRRDSNIHFVKATKFIRRMKGGSQACLLQCSDDRYYITKMLGTPQGANVLANEWVGTAMARSVGLPVPQSVMVEVSDTFIDHNPGLFFQFAKESRRPPAGVHFGSALVQTDDDLDRVLDRLTYSQTVSLKEGPAFTGISLLDLLAEMQDHRQMVFSRNCGEKTYKPTFIDFGHYCLGPNWERSSPKSGPFKYSISAFPRLWQNKSVIDNWLSQFQRRLPSVLSEAVASVPEGWYEGNLEAIHLHYQRRIEDFPNITAFFLARRTTYNTVPSFANERRALQ